MTLESFDINNPYKYTDPDGNLVQLVTRGLNNPYVYSGDIPVLQIASFVSSYVANKFTHSYFDVTPDNPADFDGEKNFKLGAYASTGNVLNGGSLVYGKDWGEGKQSRKEYSRVTVNPTNGQSDTEQIRAIMAEGNKLNNANVPYNAVPGLFTDAGANSNVFVRTAIESTGSSLSNKDYEDLSPGPNIIRSPGLNKAYNYDKGTSETREHYTYFRSMYQRFKNSFSFGKRST